MARKLKSYGLNSGKSADNSTKTTKTSSGSVPSSWLKKYDSVIASYYGEYFHGRLTANGEIYNMNALTAAHKTLPLGSVVKVTNVVNNKSVIVTINDRGPYIEGREIDLSKGSFSEIGDINKGLMTVNIEVLSIGDNKYKKQK
ncbi:MAG: septal ring lytic transglycosylase RlpA family protein [Fusobacteriaceae bacterium]|nr:septal ring lytic transglycosylase RlpA family protein [Fusobacteriaceae bacterium]MBN2837844.1 septal ring lytic transglycosylase RlpA family protein [Fusobacteriaceae bacterium]